MTPSLVKVECGVCFQSFDINRLPYHYSVLQAEAIATSKLQKSCLVDSDSYAAIKFLTFALLKNNSYMCSGTQRELHC